MPRTPKVVEDRREQILDAALRVFAQKGVTRATNQDIAREAGITSGLIYHYFQNKGALLTAILEERAPPSQLIRSIPPQALTLPPESFLRLVVQQALALMEEERFAQIIRVFLPEVIQNPAVSGSVITTVQRAVGFLGNYLAAKMESGELRSADAGLIAQVLVGSVMAFMLRRHILRDPVALGYTHAQFVEALVGTALQGLVPR